MAVGKNIPSSDHKLHQNIGFGLKGLKRFPELIPVTFFACLGGGMAVGAIAYSMYKKSDVKINRSNDSIPWEHVDASKPQKLVTIKQKWEPIPEVERMKEELKK
jgi:hypothetical protein